MKRHAFESFALVFGLLLSVISSAPTGAATTTITPDCTHLVVAGGSFEGAAGTGSMVILVANAGKRCGLEGFPKVVFNNSHGAVVDGLNRHRSSMVYGMPQPRFITLPPGGVASIGVSWADNPVNNQKCPLAAFADVSLPSGIGRLSGSPGLFEVAPCGGTLYVTPLEAGAVPMPNSG
jgi:hypothetical protein